VNEDMTDKNQPTAKAHRRDMIVAASCGVFVAAMVGLSYASVPLYDWFCRTTGFGGRPQIATSAPQGALGRSVTVRFDANVVGGLPWRFEPEQNAVQARLGDVITVNYLVTNLAARETVGQASYNVTPSTTGAYFQKINCFCFTEQRMAPGEKRDMTVVFYVDPALAKDSELDDLNTITLSYSFYAVREQGKPVADRGVAPLSRTN
jgi:cytochrome c oxidase assembly protein subunit 11